MVTYDQNMFSALSSLKEVTISTVASFASHSDASSSLFSKLPNLEAVTLIQPSADQTIPSEIGAYQFYGRKYLQHIVIPASIFYINDYSFAGNHPISE